MTADMYRLEESLFVPIFKNSLASKIGEIHDSLRAVGKFQIEAIIRQGSNQYWLNQRFLEVIRHNQCRRRPPRTHHPRRHLLLRCKQPLLYPGTAELVS